MKKKLFYLASICLMAVSCNDGLKEESLELPNQGDEARIEIRSLDEAIELAEKAANSLDKPMSRSGARRADRQSIRVIGGAGSRSAAPDTLIYAINYEDNNGFALIAAPYISDPILAVVDEGEYEEGTNNANYELFLGLANNYVSTASMTTPSIKDTVPEDPRKPYIPEPQIVVEYDTVHNYGDFHRLQQLWGQDWIEGKLCPNGLSGCTPLAMAMVISHFMPEGQVTWTYPGADIKTQNVDWIKVRQHRTTKLDIYGHRECDVCWSNDEGHMTISRLCRELGHRAQSVYEIGGTYTYPQYIKPTLQSFLPNYTITNLADLKFADVMKYLDYGLMVVRADGNAIDPDGNASLYNHSWVAEGYKYVAVDEKTYSVQKYPSVILKPTEKTLISTRRLYTALLYFNYGFYGDKNGYYNCSVFETDNEFDVNIGYYTYHFEGVQYVAAYKK